MMEELPAGELMLSTLKRLQFRDPFSGLSHLSGALLSGVGLVVLLYLSHGKPWHVTGFTIYGSTLIALYLASGVYHLYSGSERAIARLHMLDQVGIYLLIAGSYTPLCLVNLRGPWGWSLFGVVWALALTGICLRIWWRQKPQWLCLLLYLIMGWLVVVAISPLMRELSPAGLSWLAAGGLVYTVGAVIFALERPRLWPGVFGAHDLWHVMVLGGSACHFVVMALFVAPRP